LSRRALWRTLISLRHERTIVFTTHVRYCRILSLPLIDVTQFLDEADLLADHVAVLAVPGKLVAEGSPVALKSSLVEGYSIQVTFTTPSMMQHETPEPRRELLHRIRTLAPDVHVTTSPPHRCLFHLKSKDTNIVEKVLDLLEDNKEVFVIASYEVLGTSIEDIFLRLMTSEEETEKHPSSPPSVTSEAASLDLTDGRPRSPLQQSLTIFHKRALVARRSWLALFLAVLVAVAGSTIPLFFMSRRAQSCVTTFRNSTTIPLYLPESPIILLFPFNASSPILTSPPDIVSTLGETAMYLQTSDAPDNASFVNSISQNFQDFSFGAISINLDSGESLVAWEATPPGLTGLVMLNLASNILFNRDLNSSGRATGTPSLITANYESFPLIDAGIFIALKWVTFFGAAMVRLLFINILI
jgi:ATP-binding cassette subfamily A (ABC1) protein 3